MLREAELEWVRGLVEEIDVGALGDLSEWRSLHTGQGEGGGESDV
jgi:hypothetical protein